MVRGQSGRRLTFYIEFVHVVFDSLNILWAILQVSVFNVC